MMEREVKVHIIGIGSPFGDDRVGWNVIERIQQEPSLQSILSKKLQLDSCDRPYFNLLELLKPDKKIIIVDAMQSGIDIGVWHEVTINDLMSRSSPVSTHGFGLAEALQFAIFLEKKPLNLQLYGVEISNLQGFEISQAVNQGIEKLSQHIIQQIKIYILNS